MITSICPICSHNVMSNPKLRDIFIKPKIICQNCQDKFEPFEHIILYHGHPIHFIYKYNHFLKNIIYQYKATNQKDLAPVFLNQKLQEINNYYKDYTMLFPPSSKDNLRQRGFNHMELICSNTNLKYLDAFEKESDKKQTSLNREARIENAQTIKLKQDVLLPTKVLLIDDIYTTGSTIKQCINILEEKGLADIKTYIIAKA